MSSDPKEDDVEKNEKEKKDSSTVETIVFQEPMSTEDILNICNTFVPPDEGDNGGPRVIYIVQSDTTMNLDNELSGLKANTDCQVSETSSSKESTQISSNRKRICTESNKEDIVSKKLAAEEEISRHHGFLLEVADCLDHMDERRQALAKVKLMQLLYDFEFGSMEENKRKSVPPSSRIPPLFSSKSYSLSKSLAKRREIQTKLNKHELKAVDESDKHNLKSRIWDRFQRVYDTDIPLPYVSCKNCKIVYPYSSWTGTSGLLKHQCRGIQKSNSTTNVNDEEDNASAISDDFAVDDDPAFEEEVASTVVPKTTDIKIKNIDDEERLTKDEVLEMIACGDLSLVDESNSNRFKSPIWQKFYRVYDRDIATEFVSCKECGAICSYLNGTTAIGKHKCRPQLSKNVKHVK